MIALQQQGSSDKAHVLTAPVNTLPEMAICKNFCAMLCRERKFKNQQKTPRTLPRRDRHKPCWEHMTRTGKPREHRKCKDCRQQAVAEKQTAVLLAAALGNNDAEMCGNHQVGTAERECHLNLQVDPTNQDHALRGRKWTVSSQRLGHIMMGKDREDANTMHSLIHTAGNPEQMPVVGWQQQERKEFDPVSYAKRQ